MVSAWGLKKLICSRPPLLFHLDLFTSRWGINSLTLTLGGVRFDCCFTFNPSWGGNRQSRFTCVCSVSFINSIDLTTEPVSLNICTSAKDVLGGSIPKNVILVIGRAVMTPNLCLKETALALLPLHCPGWWNKELWKSITTWLVQWGLLLSTSTFSLPCIHISKLHNRFCGSCHSLCVWYENN